MSRKVGADLGGGGGGERGRQSNLRRRSLLDLEHERPGARVMAKCANSPERYGTLASAVYERHAMVMYPDCAILAERPDDQHESHPRSDDGREEPNEVGSSRHDREAVRRRNKQVREHP